jgi:hypothetical protein
LHTTFRGLAQALRALVLLIGEEFFGVVEGVDAGLAVNS